MSAERNVEERAAVHAALGDPGRLRICDVLQLGDASPSELSALLEMPSNLVAHHLATLERAGVVVRRRSEGDRRRTYLTLVRSALADLDGPELPVPERVVFVCTGNSARSQLAAALWRRASEVPTASAGTAPRDRIAPGARDVAARRGLTLGRTRPRHVDEVVDGGDFVVTVCDRAHEAFPDDLHWSVVDPVVPGTPAAFDSAFTELEGRVLSLARHLSAS